MIGNFYILKDTKAGEFVPNSVIFSSNDDVAKRTYCLMLKDNPIKDDLDVYKAVSEFDTEKGICSKSQNVFICNVLELYQYQQGDVNNAGQTV